MKKEKRKRKKKREEEAKKPPRVRCTAIKRVAVDVRTKLEILAKDVMHTNKRVIIIV